MTNVADTDATAISDDLKPCPFCGKSPYSAVDVARVHVFCPQCECRGPAIWYTTATPSIDELKALEAKSIAAWNLRNTLPTSVTDEPKRWLVEEHLPSGVIRWEAVEHEYHARKLAEAKSHPCTVSPLYLALSAALPPSRDDAQVGVRVKALAWELDGDWWGSYSGETPLGIYNVAQCRNTVDGERNTEWFVQCPGTEKLIICQDEASAKAAAQSDFKQRILSALEPAQQPIDRATVIDALDTAGAPGFGTIKDGDEEHVFSVEERIIALGAQRDHYSRALSKSEPVKE